MFVAKKPLAEQTIVSNNDVFSNTRIDNIQYYDTSEVPGMTQMVKFSQVSLNFIPS